MQFHVPNIVLPSLLLLSSRGFNNMDEGSQYDLNTSSFNNSGSGNKLHFDIWYT